MNWGILGTGVIAKKFAEQLPQSISGKLVATGSRAIDTAKAFANQYSGKAHGSYEALINDDKVEAVYLSLPNHLHHEWTIRALRAGKHVLCEKPIANNAAEAEEMFSVARSTNRLLVEAFMYRCHPGVRSLIQTVRDGAIGEVRLIRANFTFNRPANAAEARYQVEMGGGSLMDVGCYCLNFARALAGEPTSSQAIAHLHPSGVDEYAAGTLNFGGKTLAAFTCGMTLDADRICTIGGTNGFIQIDFPWLGDGTFSVVRTGGSDVVRTPAPKGIYALEADSFASAAGGESAPWITEADTLGNMRLLDELRRQVGVKVPASAAGKLQP